MLWCSQSRADCIGTVSVMAVRLRPVVLRIARQLDRIGSLYLFPIFVEKLQGRLCDERWDSQPAIRPN